MVDTRSQYHRIKSEVDQAVLDVLESSAFIQGKPVQDLATELGAYLNVSHVIPCANGTDALQIAMMALGLKPGDEVITPSFTYIATTEVIALLQLTPVFVEVDPQTFCMDPESLRKAITPRTKAIVPVHLYGQAAPMEPILQIAQEHGLFVIEDNAQAIGCEYRFSDGRTAKTGTLGHIGCTSFYPSKNLGAFGDGGAIFTNDAALAEQLKMIANHGQRTRYYHEIVGCNSRLDSVQAAILRIKLRHLDDYNQSRRNVASHYDRVFSAHPKITTPYQASYSTHVFHQYTIKLAPGVDRDGLVKFLSDRSIPSMIYYPVPGHRQAMFAAFGTAKVTLPITDALTDCVISLPIHTEMDNDQLQYISDAVMEYLS